MINKDYLKNLNKTQKEAVLHLDGPLLIVAARSGKTKVLTSRIANTIKESFSQSDISSYIYKQGGKGNAKQS